MSISTHNLNSEVTISESRNHKASPKHSAERPNPWGFSDPIVMVGDSLTKASHDAADVGFGIRLESRFRRQKDVLSRGFSGEAFLAVLGHYVKPLFEAILNSTVAADQSPSVLTLWLGTNDWSQRVPLHRFLSNMRKMAQHVKTKHPKTKLVLITPPPVLDDDGRVWALMFRDALIEMAAVELPWADVLDTWVTFLGPDAKYDPSLARFYVDNVHFNALGHETFFNDLVNHL
ncbi:hypothetical protein HDU98_011397 [Podochytrium sp. JEL0797]|nr:hypothetical protein HDU98_011397 [Podochytrium sp. JEL0797]